MYVLSVENDSAAKKAGISSGDIIIGIDNKKIENMTGLIKALYKYNKGDKATVKVCRMEKKNKFKYNFKGGITL